MSVVCKSSVCLAASKGIKEIKLDKGSSLSTSDARVCGISAAGLLLTYGTNLPVNVDDSTTFLVKKSRSRDKPGINTHNLGYPRDNPGITQNDVGNQRIFQV